MIIFENISIAFFLELIFEVFPISSSGHLLLISKFCQLVSPLSFIENNLNHVLVIFTQGFLLIPFIIDFVRNKNIKIIVHLFLLIFIISVITVLIFFIKKFIFCDIPLFLGFFITTIILFHIDQYDPREKSLFEDFSGNTKIISNGIFIGLGQSIALFPGISRFASVLFLSLFCGYSRKSAFLITLMANISISGLSFLYVLYYNYFLENIIFIFCNKNIILLIIFILLAIFFSYVVSYCYEKKYIWIMVIYEFIITIISFYQFIYYE